MNQHRGYNLLLLFLALLLTSCNPQSKRSSLSTIENKRLDQRLLTGTYQSTNSTANFDGTIRIPVDDGSSLSFEITTATARGCVGDLTGTMFRQTDGRWLYESSTCRALRFDFRDDRIIVEEEACDAHGMECWFSGVYEKID